MDDFTWGMLAGWISALCGILWYHYAGAPTRRAKDKAYYGDYRC